MCKKLLIILCLLLFCFNTLLAADKEVLDTKPEYSSEELPSIVLAYNLFCARYADFKMLESNQQNVLIKLMKNIDGLSGGISTGLAFTHKAFILQNFEGRFGGFAQIKNKTLEESKIPFENILFVTTPIVSFDNRVLAILSAVSPEQTIILAIDNKLNVELLYDSFKKNNILNVKDIRNSAMLGSIFNITVVKPGIFEVEERMAPGSRGFSSPYQKRIFIIDVSKGIFGLSLKTGK